MDVCFDLIIPEIIADEGLQFCEELVGWGDEQFSQDPPKYQGVGGVTFTRRPIPEHITCYLPNDLDVSGWVYLSLDEGVLDVWESAINHESEEIPDIPIKSFLSQLLMKLDSWVVVFELNCDQIDGVYQLSLLDLLVKIEETLNWNNEPEGFVAWHKA